MLNSEKSQSKATSRKVLSKLIDQYPFLFWGGMFVMAMTLTVGATASLLNPDLLNLFSSNSESDTTSFALEQEEDPINPTKQEAKPSPSTSFEEVKPETSDSTLPTPENPVTPPVSLLLFVGMVAAGCAGGSLLVTMAIRYLCTRRNAPMKVLQESSRKLLRDRKKRKRPKPSRTKRSAPPPRSQRVPSNLATVTPSPSGNRPTHANVTVLPPETLTPWESSPDYSQELVEQLDLRKRHSLSSLLDYRD
ncbi:hypothetical protein PN462_05340 [Spirulina sp. CS-785/01]|uniref:hypothetical protein n=1 Tax=Spirulina sp. CS-785/01 TaxID=3021716 RepID=UPI002330FF72|nr:hypothetical protein [Spirulina sp. CS-785/01]MDB9312521.1 hypothetical protein [Spirulina sp. CS-785/01]